MKLSRKSIATAAAIAAAASAVGAVSAYFTTKMLVDIALDRKAPDIMKKAGNIISGTSVDEQVLLERDETAARLESRATEQVEITARDGVTLVGHWYRCQNPKRIVIGMHGWRSSWSADFGMSSEFMHMSDCDMLYCEQRGQNSSGGDYMGFGVTERFDCMDWVDMVISQRKDDLPIYLCGLSMGATTVLMTAGLGLPDRVHGIIADCGFTSPEEIWTHVANNNLHIGFNLRRNLAGEMYKQRNNAEFSYSTVDALSVSTTPVLFIHGTDDHFVPVEMTYRNYRAAAAPKRLLVVPGADHGMSYVIDWAGYQAAVESFWRDFD